MEGERDGQLDMGGDLGSHFPQFILRRTKFLNFFSFAFCLWQTRKEKSFNMICSQTAKNN